MKIMNPGFLSLISVCIFLATPVVAETPGTLLFEDGFDWEKPSEKGWSGHTRKKGFQVIQRNDGAMQINMPEDGGHGTYAAKKLTFKDVLVCFRFKLSADKGDELRVNFNDKTKEFMKEFHAGHLCSVTIQTDEVTFVDFIGKELTRRAALNEAKERMKKGTDETEPAVEKSTEKDLTVEEKKAAEKAAKKKEAAMLSPEQKAAIQAATKIAFPVSLEADKWYTAKYEAVGEKVTLWIDGNEVGSRMSKGAAHPNKTLFRFVTPQGNPQVDDLKIYSLER